MKGFNIILTLLVMSFVCNGQENQGENKNMIATVAGFASFGQPIDADAAIDSEEMLKAYRKLPVKDTLEVKFSATVLEVCQTKGCWMKLQLDNGEESMVRFKDYGFFVPKDITGKTTVVNGLAYMEEMTVEDQKHYAQDAGKSEEEISKIVKAKKKYAFEADGVLIKE